jgi:2-polyprenyl-3-methyl-5-hydroxy-6-metoxy-1,4-benzoquinol methylase
LNTTVIKSSKELAKRYKDLGIEHIDGVWNRKHLKNFDVARFRADSIYVWQTRQFQEINYYLTYLYILEIDKLGLLGRLQESGDYGVETFSFENGKVSRDLMDSVIEIHYLNDVLSLSNQQDLQILDIGAGYGRFAHRILESFPESNVTCIDAIPLSTCISRIYLGSFIQSKRATVHDLESLNEVKPKKFNLAVNIHSFSEMSLKSVKFWINFLVKNEVEFLFVVPNGPELALNDGTNFGLLLQQAGFEILDRREKYHFGEYSKFAIYPSTYYLLQKTK